MVSRRASRPRGVPLRKPVVAGRALALSLVPLCLATVHCGGTSPGPGDSLPWRAATETVGGVTTVRTLEGSAWSRPARLREELRIGVDEGRPHEMLGSVAGVAATDDRIFVLDSSVPVVRVFSTDGEHLMDIGRAGDGPGELRQPLGIGLSGDRLFVRDFGTYRINVYDADGAPAEDYAMRAGYMTSDSLVIHEGNPYSPSPVDRQSSDPGQSMAMVGYGPDGVVGEPLRPPRFARQPERLQGPGPPCPSMPVPYAAGYVWAMDSQGSLFGAISDSYSIRERRADGTSLVIEREAPAIALGREHRDYARRYMTAFYRAACGPEWTWIGPDVPDTKPVFDELLPTHTGELWVIRRGESRRLPDATCDTEPIADGNRPGRRCWVDEMIVDVFDADGRFLGEVELPTETQSSFRPVTTFISGDVVYTATEDTRGVVRVLRYRMDVALHAPR